MQDQFAQCLLGAWSDAGHCIVIISLVLFRSHNPLFARQESETKDQL